MVSAAGICDEGRIGEEGDSSNMIGLEGEELRVLLLMQCSIVPLELIAF
jgi:hypothetical protein